MYRPIVKLNTNVCEVCYRKFKNEKSLKDHIFNRRVSDTKHALLKERIRKKRFENAKLLCPICKQKCFRNIRRHIDYSKDKKHKTFLKKQKDFFIKNYLSAKSCTEILKMNNEYTKGFSYKYLAYFLVEEIGKSRFSEISKANISKRVKDRWKRFSKEERKAMMRPVYEAEWKNLSAKQRKKHPWVIAGRKASLESAKRGSKNQRYAFELLRNKLPSFNWKYNHCINEDWQIDIASTKKLIFIEWDGRHHFVPIYGKGYLNNRINRDKIKNRLITKYLNGSLIRIKDEGRFNKDFVEAKVKEICEIIKNGLNKGALIRI